MSIFKRQKDNNEALTVVEPGYQTRDFVHVSDVVHANILASQKELDNYGEVFNIGTGEGTEIEEIANLISDYQIRIPQRPGEVMHSRANIDRAKKILGWEWSIKILDWIKKEIKNGQK
jgi:UDP-glucose 4-epimerase